MNSLAIDLNTAIKTGNAHLVAMLARIGRELYFPKGILSQSAEAKQKAHKLNATIGIATEKGFTMNLPSVMEAIPEIPPEGALTYAPAFGVPSLRMAWQDLLFAKNPSLSDKRVSLPVVTAGITHALSVFADLWVDPGDVVILPDMIWGNYNLIFGVRKGAETRTYPLFEAQRGFNLAGFEARVRQEARTNAKLIVLLNFPQNPTGYTLTEAEADQVVRILETVAAEGTDVIALVDDAYFGLVYEDGILRESIFARLCGRHPRLLTVKLDGATKEEFAWGLRVGFITYGACVTGDPQPVYEALERKTGGAIRGSVSNASHLSQSVVLKALQNEHNRSEKNEKFAILQRRAAQVKEVLRQPRYHAAWDVYSFNSGYFMCIRLKTVDAEALRCHVLDAYGVGVIAIDGRNLRIAFSSLEEGDIAELFDILLQGVKDLSGKKD